MKYISVPIDKDGDNDLEYGKENSDHVITYKMSDEECQKLFDGFIFARINDKYNLMIDEYETEIIQHERLDFCKDLLKENGFENTNFMKGIDLALKYNTYVQLDL